MAFSLIESAAAYKNAEGIRTGNVKAWITIQETKPQNISPEKAPRGAKERVEQGELRAAGLLLPDIKFGERIYLSHLPGKAGERIMVQIALKPKNGAVAFHLFVHECVASPPGSAPVDQSQGEVRIPVSVRNPSIDEPDFPGKTDTRVRGARAAAKEVLDFLPQLNGDLLVRVEAQRPPAFGEIKRGVLGVAKAFPFKGDHPGAKMLCNVRAFIDGIVQGDDDFRDPSVHACQAAWQVSSFVAGNDHNRDWKQ